MAGADVTIETYQELATEGNVLLDIWGPQCAPCMALMPAVEELGARYEGKVRLLDKKQPDSYRLVAEGSGGPGFVKADTLITLTETDGGTRVSYSADVQVGGLIAGVGQRMLGGVSKMMADQFFNRMSDLLQSS